MIKSVEILEVVRLDDLETKGWKYYAKGVAEGSMHTVARAEKLITGAHRTGLNCVSANQGQPWIWNR